MLTNYITDVDLESYYPNIGNHLWKDVSDYSTQISEAFDLVLDEVRNRGIEPRTLHLPLDLNRAADSTADQNTITSVTKTSTATSTHINGLIGYRRLVVDVTSIVTTACTYSFALQGSNDLDITNTTEPTNWSTIGTVTLDAVEANTVLFQEEYRYYRYVLTVTGATASIAFTAGIVETYPDRWIVWKALQIIFEDFQREQGDIWAQRALNMKSRFETAMESAKMRIDSDDDNLPEDTDDEETPATRLTR